MQTCVLTTGRPVTGESPSSSVHDTKFDFRTVLSLYISFCNLVSSHVSNSQQPRIASIMKVERTNKPRIPDAAARRTKWFIGKTFTRTLKRYCKAPPAFWESPGGLDVWRSAQGFIADELLAAGEGWMVPAIARLLVLSLPSSWTHGPETVWANETFCKYAVYDTSTWTHTTNTSPTFVAESSDGRKLMY